MAKIVLSDKEFNSLPDSPPKRKKRVVLSDKDFRSLPDDGPEIEEDSDGIIDTILSGISTGAEYVDRYTGAPVRSAIGAAQEGENPISAYTDQFGEPTESAPTGKEIVQRAGVSDTSLSDVLPSMYSDDPEKADEWLTFEKGGAADISASGAAGLAVDLAADPVTLINAGAKAAGYAAKSIKPVRLALKSRASNNAFKSLSQISTNAKVRKAFENSRPEFIGRHVLESDLGQYLNKPSVMLEKIKGKPITKYKQQKIGNKFIDSPYKGRTGGIISDISKETDDYLGKISSRVGPIDSRKIAGDLKGRNIRLREEFGSAEKLSASEIATYQKEVDETIKPLLKGSGTRSIQDIQKLKRNIGKKLSSNEFFAPTDKKLIMEKAAMLDIYHELKRVVNDSVQGIPVLNDAGDVVDAGVLIGVNNDRINALMDVGNLLENIPAKELRGANTAQKVTDLLVSGSIGTGVAAVSGSPAAGLVTGGLYGAGKVGKKLADKIPAAAANALESFVNPSLAPSKSMILPASKVLKEDNMNRSPDSAEEPIAEQLIRTPLPRSTDRILQNKDFAMAKVAQQAPEMFDQLRDVLTNDPEAIDELLPMMVMQFPAMFERDKYNRVDGRIIDPQMKELARKDTMNNEDMDILRKTQKLHKLNKTGYFDDN